MKILYVRFNQNTDLDMAIGSVASRCTEERLGIIEGLVELGHSVTVASHVSAKHMHVFDGRSKGVFDNSWMRSLRYDLKPDIDKHDFMIVETASVNTMYGFTQDGIHIPYIKHFADLLYEAQGMPIVIAHMGQSALAFPFRRLCKEYYTTPLEKLSSNNLRVLFDGIDILNDNPHILWTKAYTTKAFIDAFHPAYDIPLHGYVNTPIGYSPRYDTRTYNDGSVDRKYDLVYVGKADRPERIARVAQLYDDPDYTAYIVGKGWDTHKWIHGNVQCPGQVGYQGDVYNLYGLGDACVLCLDKELAAAGMSTTRHVQSIRSGCITMADSSILGASNWVGAEFLVDDADDVYDVLIQYCYNADAITQANNYQHSLLHTWVDVLQPMINTVYNI